MTGPQWPAAGAFWIRVPASTSNLGPGFDTLGMAVDAFLEVTWEAGEAPLRVTRSGTLEAAPWAPEDDFVVRVLLEPARPDALSQNHLGLHDHPVPRGRIHLRSEIPLGRGLGSSAAARIAGAALRCLLSGAPVTREELLREAAGREGHPDNAAPAILGGLVAAQLDPDGGVVAVPLPLSRRIGWVFAMPGVGLDTARARAALPGTIPVPAAVRNAGRLALLIPGLAGGDEALLRRAMEDELHVPYRLPLVPGASEAAAAARAAGAWAVTLSGAGSGLIAAVPTGAEERVGRAMAQAFESHPRAGGGAWRVVRPWLPGAQWGSGPLRPRGPERFATSPG